MRTVPEPHNSSLFCHWRTPAFRFDDERKIRKLHQLFDRAVYRMAIPFVSFQHQESPAFFQELHESLKLPSRAAV